jgi:hypothetical protein
MPKIKIENYVFVADAFGPIPVWSIQHPDGVDKGAYVLEATDPDSVVQDKKSAYSRDLFRRINETFPAADIYITGWLEYEEDKESGTFRITFLEIEKMTLYPDEDAKI